MPKPRPSHVWNADRPDRPTRCNDFQGRNTRKHDIRGLSCHNKMLLVNRCFVPTKIIRVFSRSETDHTPGREYVPSLGRSVPVGSVFMRQTSKSPHISHVRRETIWRIQHCQIIQRPTRPTLLYFDNEAHQFLLCIPRRRRPLVHGGSGQRSDAAKHRSCHFQYRRRYRSG